MHTLIITNYQKKTVYNRGTSRSDALVDIIKTLMKDASKELNDHCWEIYDMDCTSNYETILK